MNDQNLLGDLERAAKKGDFECLISEEISVHREQSAEWELLAQR